jgi:hypothetical protein
VNNPKSKIRNRKPSGVRRRLLCALLHSAVGLPALAQSYSLDWFTLDGGGGTSTGGVFAVSGTIGQPDAGAMSGGTFHLPGGFWSFTAVQTPGAPVLHMANLLNGTARLTWTPDTPGFIVQQVTALTPVPIVWSNAPVNYTNGAVIPVTPGMRHLRLFRP